MTFLYSCLRANRHFLNLFLQYHKEEIERLPPVLAGEVDKLPEILHKSRAANTSKKYELSFIRYTKWAMGNGISSGDILPAKPLLVSLYLCSLIQTANTPSPVITAFYALEWIHDMYGFNSPTESKESSL